MKKALLLSSMLLAMLALNGCDWFDDDDDDAATTAGAGTTAPAAAPEAAPATTTADTTVGNSNPQKENHSWYRGRTNGNRPTWYFAKKMSSYPSTFTLNIPGCRTGMIVKNNGHRWESGGYLAKQSDVSGRGMVVLAPASCGAKSANITF